MGVLSELAKSSKRMQSMIDKLVTRVTGITRKRVPLWDLPAGLLGTR